MESDAVIQREIRSLLKERYSLKSSIRRISAQIGSGKVLRGSNIVSPDAPVTLLSTKSTLESGGTQKRKMHDAMDEDVTEEPEKRPKLTPGVEQVEAQRRIMRSSLLGHLQRARDALSKEQEMENTMKQREKEQMIASKLAEQEREKLENISAELRTNLASNEERLRAVETELAEKNNTLMKSALKRHYDYMSNFIATKTQPTIFWVPRNFNSELESLRECTRQFIEQKVAAIASTNYYSNDAVMIDGDV
ncbi:nuclear factor NF2, putative [Babesia ovis]|uniref:Nuclear factor NF2, putative n=1 Tax=Babesia ovis TaxID=5869 RepID=A0A9W5TA26_BABOV|nr:nuclear factor NF2, putative [Babesia ovis]